MGGRFCSLDQTHSECESYLVKITEFPPQNRVKTKKKKGLRRKILPEFVGFIRADGHFFV